MNYYQQKQDKGGIQFINPVCKRTFNSLPKIYGGLKPNIQQQKQSRFIFNRQGKNRHKRCINSQTEIQQEIQKKKPMKFHISRLELLSAPRYNNHSCKKNNCSCSLHIKNENKGKSKGTIKRKLEPLKLYTNTSRPDDSQSSYKVRTKTQNSPQKVGHGLLGLIQQQARISSLQIKEQNSENYEISEVEIYEAKEEVMPRMKTEQISYIRLLDEDKQHADEKNAYQRVKTVQIQTLTAKNNQIQDPNDEINIINNDIQIQVNLQQEQNNQGHQEDQQDKKIEQQQKQKPETDEERQQHNRSLLLKSLRNKKQQSKYKKLYSMRKHKYQYSEEQQGLSEQEQSSKQQEQNHQANQEKLNSVRSSIPSSLSMNSVIAHGLKISKTQFKQANDQYQTGKQLRLSRAKSTRSNGTFIIPERKEYGRYLKTYRTMDKKGFSINKLIQSPLFRIVQEDDSVYFGEYENEKKEGSALNISEHEIFEGTYKDDKKVKGSERNVDGIYKGYFKDGKREGYGTFQWNNGEKFEGNWKDGVKEGFGIWRSPKGDYYQGQWFNNRQQGQGTFKHKNSQYKGEFMNFLKHGQGRQQFVNGDKYIGQYKYGKPDGKGTYTWHNKSIYVGEFKNGMRCGNGKWIQRQLTISQKSILIETYEGQFVNDYKDGKGKEVNERTGDYFEGQFTEGIRMKGILYDAEGKIKQVVEN